MKTNVIAYLAGLVFGLGLLLSGMADPQKVIGFLDVAGAWDPSLGFVMIGAISVYVVAWRIVRKRSAPLYASKFHLPEDDQLDARLIGGSAIFGVGWGLSGICPGPAIVNVAGGSLWALVFVGGMTLGMSVLALRDADNARATASAGSGSAG